MSKDRFLVPGVDARTPAGEAATLTLLSKAAPLFDAESAVLEATDPDAVHDMRVASRRLREAMSLFSPVMRKKPLARQLDTVRRITRALGPVRDSDVLIDSFRKMARACEDEGERRAIAYLIGRRQGERVAELRRMRRRLARLDLAAWRTGFVAFAEEPRSSGAAAEPLVLLGSGVLEDRLARTYAHIPAALEADAAEEQHAMRVACKHLRYAIETLAPCFDDSFSHVHRTLVTLQDILGDMHDIDVWSAYVAAVREAGEHSAAHVSDRAIGAVLRDLAGRRAKLFTRFERHVAAHPEQALAGRVLGGLDE
jgi:CHAD domain-containing protein